MSTGYRTLMKERQHRVLPFYLAREAPTKHTQKQKDEFKKTHKMRATDYEVLSVNCTLHNRDESYDTEPALKLVTN